VINKDRLELPPSSDVQGKGKTVVHTNNAVVPGHETKSRADLIKVLQLVARVLLQGVAFCRVPAVYCTIVTM
jgi:hypothetical protein